MRGLVFAGICNINYISCMINVFELALSGEENISSLRTRSCYVVVVWLSLFVVCQEKGKKKVVGRVESFASLLTRYCCDTVSPRVPRLLLRGGTQKKVPRGSTYVLFFFFTFFFLLVLLGDCCWAMMRSFILAVLVVHVLCFQGLFRCRCMYI